jgi:hypothetical protein
VYNLELLSREHDRNHFDCGSEPLNAHLRQTALQHIERGISRTFVLVHCESSAPKPVLGFVTLNLCQLKTESLPEELAKRLPREVAGSSWLDWQYHRIIRGAVWDGFFSSPP